MLYIYILYNVLLYLTLASCWLSSSVRALLSQCSACSGLGLLVRLLQNRWDDCSLGEGSRDTISGERWLTILLRAGCLWDTLGKKSDQGAGPKERKWTYCTYQYLGETCKCKRLYWRKDNFHISVYTDCSLIHFTYDTANVSLFITKYYDIKDLSI